MFIGSAARRRGVLTRRHATVAILAVVIPALIAGSLMPTPAKVWLGITLPHVHAPVHLAAFGITAWLLISLADTWRIRLLAALAVCLMAISLEIGEWLFYRNAMEWMDVLHDVLGVLAALLITLPRVARSESANPEASEK